MKKISLFFTILFAGIIFSSCNSNSESAFDDARLGVVERGNLVNFGGYKIKTTTGLFDKPFQTIDGEYELLSDDDLVFCAYKIREDLGKEGEYRYLADIYNLVLMRAPDVKTSSLDTLGTNRIIQVNETYSLKDYFLFEVRADVNRSKPAAIDLAVDSVWNEPYKYYRNDSLFLQIRYKNDNSGSSTTTLDLAKYINLNNLELPMVENEKGEVTLVLSYIDTYGDKVTYKPKDPIIWKRIRR